MAVYYNEIDAYAAEWLRNLMKEGLIPDGEVDTRSIVDVRPSDLRGFRQAHFFAGIAGWSHALRIAGWADDRAIWTGSAPCQPFSIAGKGKGTDDQRHLWPVFFNLIRECRPPVVMGEQVAGSAGYGWFDGVAADLEAESYTSRAVDIPACAVDAPHIRQRIYWVAVDDAMCRRHRHAEEEICAGRVGSELSSLSDADMADADSGNSFWWSGPLQVGWNAIEGQAAPSSDGERAKWRIKPGLSLLADGVPNRVGRLRAYGNAIVPPLAAEVIRAFMEAV